MVRSQSQPVRVLLIEDDAGDAVAVRETLRDSGPTHFKLQTAARLAEGLACLAQGAFDVVLLDLALPDSTGIETFTQVRDGAHELPIVILSGDANDAVAMQALAHGAQDYLVKGAVHTDLLARTLLYAITRQRLTTQLRESEHRLSLLAEQLPALMWTTDGKLQLTSWRGRDLDLFALPPQQVLGRTLCEVLGTDSPSHPCMVMHRSALEGESSSGEVQFCGRWYHAHIEPLRDGRGEVTGAIGVAVDVTRQHKLIKDIEAAHRVQQHMLPALAPRLAGFDIAGGCFPAEHCSGDFFDYIPLPDERLAVVLADVSGHGFGPAIMASAIRSYLRTAAVLGNHVHEMLALSNRLLVHDAEASPFASVFAARIDAPSRSFQFASAGHPAYLLRQDGQQETLETKCVPIGVRDDEVFPLSRSIRLHRGDLLVMASDGVFEARRGDGEFFGVPRALQTVLGMRQLPAREIVSELHRAACEFAGGQQLDDDLTVVVVKRQAARNRS